MYAEPTRFRFIQGGSMSLPLAPIIAVPERHDVTMYGQFFRGDSVHLVRRLEGRVHGNVCYRAYEIVITIQTNTAWRADPRFNPRDSSSAGLAIYLSYTTGLGTQHFEVRSYAMREHIHELTSLNDNALHAILVTLVKAQEVGAGYGYQKAEHEYREAFVEGRLKKRKVRGRDLYEVEIEPSVTEALRVAA